MRQASDGESVGVARPASMAKFLLGERLKAVKAKSVFSCPERYTRVRESTPIRQASAAANTAPSVGRLLFPSLRPSPRPKSIRRHARLLNIYVCRTGHPSLAEDAAPTH